MGMSHLVISRILLLLFQILGFLMHILRNLRLSELFFLHRWLLVVKVLVIVFLHLRLRMFFLRNWNRFVLTVSEPAGFLLMWTFLCVFINVVIVRLWIFILLVKFLHLTLNAQHFAAGASWLLCLLLHRQVKYFKQCKIVEVFEIDWLQNDLGDDEVDILFLQLYLVQEGTEFHAIDGPFAVTFTIKGCGDVLTIVGD